MASAACPQRRRLPRGWAGARATAANREEVIRGRQDAPLRGYQGKNEFMNCMGRATLWLMAPMSRVITVVLEVMAWMP